MIIREIEKYYMEGKKHKFGRLAVEGNSSFLDLGLSFRARLAPSFVDDVNRVSEYDV